MHRIFDLGCKLEIFRTEMMVAFSMMGVDICDKKTVQIFVSFSLQTSLKAVGGLQLTKSFKQTGHSFNTGCSVAASLHVFHGLCFGLFLFSGAHSQKVICS